VAEIYDHGDRHEDEVKLELILQRIFQEKDPAAHKAAIWDLFGPSDDWQLFEKLTEIGGQRSIEAYFHNLIDNFDEAADEFGVESDEQRDQIKEMYAAPLVSLHTGDWAGSASAMHEILLNEIYGLYNVDENELPFGDATAFGLKKWISEELLFPLSVLEYMAYSDYLMDDMNLELLENNLSLMLTMFFSAQAFLDLRGETRDDDLGLNEGEDA
jgi:hypothetical protein